MKQLGTLQLLPLTGLITPGFLLGFPIGLWRRGSLVVSTMDFRSGGWWFEPSLCHRVVSLDKKVHSTSGLRETK